MTCRAPKPRKPETWTELVDSGMDEEQVITAILAAAHEHIEDQEREIAELKAKLVEANSAHPITADRFSRRLDQVQAAD